MCKSVSHGDSLTRQWQTYYLGDKLSLVSWHPLKSAAWVASIGEKTIRAVLICLGLFVLWLLMSGIYTPMVIGFGAASSVLSVWIAQRLGILDIEGPPVAPKLSSLIRYTIWLIVEIAKADWAVTKVILAPNMRLHQRLIRVPATESSNLGKLIFANSITITPGTLTVEVEENSFIVHALRDEAANLEALADMNNRVTAVENCPVRGQS